MDVDFIPAAVEASKAVGAPVKLIWTREDDMTHDTFRPPAREEVSAGFDAGGNLVAWKLHITSPSITARASIRQTRILSIPWSNMRLNYPYAVPNFALTYSRQEIGIDVGYMRSVSHAPNCFVIESFMDELAAAASKNPLDFRLELLAKTAPRARARNRGAARGLGPRAAGPAPGNCVDGGLHDVYWRKSPRFRCTMAELKVHKITCVVDCGQMVNPRIVESQIESGIVFGLTSALWGEITIVGGRVQQSNFNDYRLLRSNELPRTRRAPAAERRSARRHRRSRGAAGGARDLQCDFRRHRKAPSLPADRGARAFLSDGKPVASKLAADLRTVRRNSLPSHHR